MEVTPARTVSPPPQSPPALEPKYGGFTRFEIELEFVQSLANPWYLNHLASQKFLAQPSFVAYLAYLQYWQRPPYLKYLTYPGPTLRHLELLQSEKFRQDIISPDVAARLYEEGLQAAQRWHEEGTEGGTAVAEDEGAVVVPIVGAAGLAS